MGRRNRPKRPGTTFLSGIDLFLRMQVYTEESEERMSARQQQEPKNSAAGDIDHIKRRSLADYAASQETAKAIAARHGINIRTLRRWIDAAGSPRRPLGRQPLLEPTGPQQAILRQIGSVRIAQLAREAGQSR